MVSIVAHMTAKTRSLRSKEAPSAGTNKSTSDIDNPPARAATSLCPTNPKQARYLGMNRLTSVVTLKHAKDDDASEGT
jgi:hypothetical protein